MATSVLNALLMLFRDYVLDQGILSPLLTLLTKSTRLSMTR